MITERNHPDSIHVATPSRVDNTDQCANIDVAEMGALIPAVQRPPGGELPTFPCDFLQAPVFKPVVPKKLKKPVIVRQQPVATRYSRRIRCIIVEKLPTPGRKPRVPLPSCSPHKPALRKTEDPVLNPLADEVTPGIPDCSRWWDDIALQSDSEVTRMQTRRSNQRIAAEDQYRRRIRKHLVKTHDQRNTPVPDPVLPDIVPGVLPDLSTGK